MTDVTVELLTPEARILAGKAEEARLSAARSEAAAVRAETADADSLINANAAKNAAATAASDAANNIALLSTEQRIAAPLYDTSFLTFPSYLKDYMTRTGLKGAIYDAGTLSSMWKDVAGTQPAAVGDTIFRIDDLSGNGRHLRAFGTSNIGVLRRDDNGCLYLDQPAGTYAASNAFIAATTFGASTYVACAIAQMQRNGSEVLFSLAADGARGIFFSSLNNGSRIGVRFQDQDAGLNFGMMTPQGSAPQGIPIVADVQLTPNLMTSWINGSPRSIADAAYQYDGGVRIAATGTAGTYSRAGVNIGIGYKGNSPSTMATRFYGAAWVDGAVDGSTRRAIHSWLRWRTGQLALESLVYDVFIVTGQSNAQGVGQIENSPVPLLGQGGYWNDFGYVAQMADPVRQLGGDVALTGSAWPRFAQRWYQRTGNPCLIVGAAASGCGILIAGPAGAWGTVGSLVDKAAAKYNEVVAAMGSRMRLKGLIYCGGEQDVAAFSTTATVANYAPRIVDIRDRLRTLINAPNMPMFIISSDRSATASEDANFQKLRDAQVAAGATDAKMKLVVPYQDFTGQGQKTDGVHWNQTAQNTVGGLAPDSIATFYGYP